MSTPTKKPEKLLKAAAIAARGSDGAPRFVPPPNGCFCRRCGQKQSANLNDHVLCCLFGEPNEKHECAWCGDDLPISGIPAIDEERVFCGSACSYSFHLDAQRNVFGSVTGTEIGVPTPVQGGEY